MATRTISYELREDASSFLSGKPLPAIIANKKNCGMAPLFSCRTHDHRPPKRLLILLLFSAIALAPLGALSQPSGVFAIWPGHFASALNKPNVSGGQVMVEWRDIQPNAPDQFDWERLEIGLARVAAAGLTATIQVNAKKHPDWLIDSVPRLTPLQLADPALQTIANKTDNSAGLPMYWHPAYMSAMQRMIEGVAQFIAKTDLRGSITGIRLNYNAIGTEHYVVPSEVRSADQWDLPAGVTRGTDWTFQTAEEYKSAVEGFYLDAFGYRGGVEPITTVYMRARSHVSDAYTNMLREDRRIGVFHTSSEPEPFNDNQEKQYELFRELCSAGSRPCYAEPWSAAVSHKERDDVPPMSAEQWHYWRHLGDLQLGASIVAEYNDDLQAVGPAAAFDETRALTSRYAGTLGKPQLAPGGWIAFREGEFLCGDYSFLIQAEYQEEAAGYTHWQIEAPEEGEDPRYGVWSRVLQPGNRIRLSLHPELLDGLSGADAVEIRVVAKPADPETIEELPLSPPSRLRQAVTSAVATEAVAQPSELDKLQLRVTGPPAPIVLPLDSAEGHWSELVQPIATPNPSVMEWTLEAENGAVEIHLFEVRRSIGE